ncbi:hypothetical protein [Aestuariivita sp.]|jgi:hypothetical protein|uniref:hypothetical protein n=1 Tax=Aestuariivita sp. TaxID=1872407 RepID=UPI00216E23CA|nr:hypothetical protein [Aestuariivita sp.]MCE8008682.1 hypothetical protein [Aestuariivita sp.]
MQYPYQHTYPLPEPKTEPSPCRSELWGLTDTGRAPEVLSLEWLLDHAAQRWEAHR